MKLQILTTTLAIKSTFSIYNIIVSDKSEDGFMVNWEDSNPAGDYYKVSVIDRMTQETIDAQETSEMGASFTGLESASIFDIVVQPMNATDSSAINDGNRAEARTNGNRVIISSEWGSGAQGYVLWDLPEAGSCGSAFNFAVPCEDAEWFSLGVGETVGVVKNSNSSMTVHASNKANLDRVQWAAFGASCNWTAYAAEDFTFEAIAGYEEFSEEVSFQNHTWTQVPGYTVRQLVIDVPEEMRQDCAPTASISVNCESTVVGGWSFNLDEGTGVFDEGTGSVNFSGSLTNDWISSFGFTYQSSDDCDDQPVVTINYQSRA